MRYRLGPFAILQAIVAFCSNASASLIVATPVADGIVVCADVRGVRGDASEILSTKLFIVNSSLVFGGTGDTAYLAGNLRVFDAFALTERYLRGIDDQQQIPGLGRFLQTEFQSFVSRIPVNTVDPFQIIVFYVARNHSPFFYLAKLMHKLPNEILLSEEQRGGEGTVFFQMASLTTIGDARLDDELKSGHRSDFDGLRRNRLLMDLILLRTPASSVTYEQAISAERLLIQETSKRIDHHGISEESNCLVLPYAGGAAWK